MLSRYIPRRIQQICYLSLLWISLTYGLPASAQWQEKYYNPVPAEQDVILPMPCQGNMVFRKVEIPQATPLADYGITLGQDGSKWGYIEQAHPEFIAGSFTEKAKGSRYYLMAKYEVTDLQYQAVMQDECPKPGMKKLLPATRLSWFDAIEFTKNYNLWLLNNAPETLPVEDSSPGYLRLPTEVEWEFAVRGGLSVTSSQFRDRVFPIDGGLNKYVWFSGSTSANGKLNLVGRLSANPLGLYDILGNADEIVFEPFRLNKTDRMHGQYGGFVVRGGNYLTPQTDIRSSARQEKPFFSKNSAYHAKSTGFRLVIVAQAFTSRKRVLEIEAEWKLLGDAGFKQQPSNNSNPVSDIAKINSDVEDGELKNKLKKLERTILANSQARNEQRDKAIRLSLRLGAFLCTKLQDDGKLLDYLQSRYQRDCVDSDSSPPACVNRKTKLSGSQDLLNFTLQFYADTVVESGLTYEFGTIFAQVPVSKTELGGRGVSNLDKFLDAHWKNLQGHMKNGKISRNDWLNRCKSI